ncbi:unnamed protein product [Closterium sp. NIES-65]|nr:unnamed protein product [Closterium sp. NIES-65]CAI6010800.1 unnamed protein product [Closterium sp. NIES-65]
MPAWWIPPRARPESVTPTIMIHAFCLFNPLPQDVVLAPYIDAGLDVVLAPYIDAGLVVYHRVRELPFVEGNFTAYLNRQFRCKQGAAFNHWVQVGRKGAEGQSI